MSNAKTLSRTLIIGLAASLALAGCKKKEDTSEMAAPPPPAAEPAATTPPPATAPAAAAVTVSGITVGNTAAADKSVAPLATLGSKDKIIVSVKTEGTATGANLGVKLTFQDGQVAGEQSATLNTTGAETTNVEFTNANGWPAGTYTAQASVDGQAAGMPQTFEVK
ncbi:hypothetical protein ARC20_15480 [Stenotrophomonas panacihumi]|uniref:Bacterial Ig-like domain-containing protein n=1 Tax=Stenotrophomonas panacihumi TaxID=676599 RepID=A0A0R0A9M1_9GAMM|nr:hypothetical protein [Stenotrophomonas panacihumi]KRG38039.1 hypothetical protein ARC20_15480 [Stenotrophomonas panacihumi]PTN53508.1 hypothetical protein C9J98_15250 [Stenotrophomonas panacihumi]